MFVIDSNIAIAALNGNRTVQGHFAEVRTSEIGLPAVVVAELLFGPIVLGASRATCDA